MKSIFFTNQQMSASSRYNTLQGDNISVIKKIQTPCMEQRKYCPYVSKALLIHIQKQHSARQKQHSASQKQHSATCSQKQHSARQKQHSATCSQNSTVLVRNSTVVHVVRNSTVLVRNSTVLHVVKTAQCLSETTQCYM